MSELCCRQLPVGDWPARLCRLFDWAVYANGRGKHVCSL